MAVLTPTAPPRFAARVTSARTALRLNAVLSITAGLITFFTAWPLAEVLGIAEPRIVLAAGALMTLYGADALTFAIRRGLRPQHVLPFALADATLVLGSVLLLVLAPDALSAAGRAVIAIAAGVCAWFAVAQYRGARALSA